MIEKIVMIIGIIGGIILLVIPFILSDRCPDCKGKLIDNAYDENIGKIVWTCTKCGQHWIFY